MKSNNENLGCNLILSILCLISVSLITNFIFYYTYSNPDLELNKQVISADPGETVWVGKGELLHHSESVNVTITMDEDSDDCYIILYESNYSNNDSSILKNESKNCDYFTNLNGSNSNIKVMNTTDSKPVKITLNTDNGSLYLYKNQNVESFIFYMFIYSIIYLVLFLVIIFVLGSVSAKKSKEELYNDN